MFYPSFYATDGLRRRNMNPVIEAINKRKSVRSYKSEPVAKEIINALVEAGNEAPSVKWI